MKFFGKVGVLILFLCCSICGVAQKWIPIDAEEVKPKSLEIKIIKSDAEGLTIEMLLPGFNSREEKIETETYQHIEIIGGGYTANIGSPELPIFSTHVEVPFGGEAEVEMIDNQFKIMSNYNIYPVQEPWPNISEVKKPPFTKDESVYSSNSFYPAQVVQVSKSGEIRGYQVVFLAVFPIQYNPVSKELKIYSTLTVRLNYTGMPEMTEEIESESKRKKAKYNKDFEPIYQSSILNYQRPSREIMDIIEASPDSSFDGANYLIITPDDLYSAMLPLKTHRESTDGFIVRIEKLSDIPPGDANSIKNYIQNAYDNWNPAPTYVLLVGDADFLPTNYVTNHPSTYEDNEKIGTDLYYSTVAGSDYLPDLFLGRLPGDSLEVIQMMVNRIINYEKNPPIKTCMFSRVLLAAYDEPGRYFVPTSDDIAKYLNGEGYTCNKVYTGGSYSGSTNDVISSINNGVFLVIHRDHGNSRNAPRVAGADGWGHPSFNTSHLSSLSNGKMLPVMFSMNCRSGWFDGETDKDAGSIVTDCFGEALLKLSKGGVVGFFGATRISYSGYNDELTDGFIDAIWPNFNPSVGGSTSLKRLGQILNQGKSYMYDTYVLTSGAGYPWTPTPIYTQAEYEEFHLLGDPAMKIHIKKIEKCEDPPNGCCGQKDTELSLAAVVGIFFLNSYRRTIKRKRGKR